MSGSPIQEQILHDAAKSDDVEHVSEDDLTAEELAERILHG